jgi:hypothetical protein
MLKFETTIGIHKVDPEAQKHDLEFKWTLEDALFFEHKLKELLAEHPIVREDAIYEFHIMKGLAHD